MITPMLGSCCLQPRRSNAEAIACVALPFIETAAALAIFIGSIYALNSGALPTSLGLLGVGVGGTWSVGIICSQENENADSREKIFNSVKVILPFLALAIGGSGCTAIPYEVSVLALGVGIVGTSYFVLAQSTAYVHIFKEIIQTLKADSGDKKKERFDYEGDDDNNGFYPPIPSFMTERRSY